MVPVLVTDDGEVIKDSTAIVDWAKRNPAGSARRLRPAGSSWLLPAALRTVYVVWGSTYLAIRIMVETMPALLTAGARFAIAGAIFLAVLGMSGASARAHQRGAGGGGDAGRDPPLFGGNGLVTVAEEEVPSGLAALVIGAVPLWVALLRLVDGSGCRARRSAGVALDSWAWLCSCCPATGRMTRRCWACSCSCWPRSRGRPAPSTRSAWTCPPTRFVSTGFQMLFGGAAMVVRPAAGEGAEVDIGAFSTRSVVAFLYLISSGR